MKTNKSIKGIIVAIILILTSCDVEKMKETNIEYVSYSIAFFKEPKSGLCFALTNPSFDTRDQSIACVPCDSVKHLIK